MDIQNLDLLLDSTYGKILVGLMMIAQLWFWIRFCHMAVRRWQRSRWGDFACRNWLARFFERIWIACRIWNWYYISPIPEGDPARFRMVRRNGVNVREDYFTHMVYTIRTQGMKGKVIDRKTPYPKRLVGWDLSLRLMSLQLLTSDDDHAKHLFAEAKIHFPQGTQRRKRHSWDPNWWFWHHSLRG